MIIYDLQDDFIDMQARAFCTHAESNPRFQQLASVPYNELSEKDREELLRLFDYASISFTAGEGDDWWK